MTVLFEQLGRLRTEDVSAEELRIAKQVLITEFGFSDCGLPDKEQEQAELTRKTFEMFAEMPYIRTVHVFRLLEDSPCVDTATPGDAADVDLRGVHRPQGDGYDRGAHEFFEFFSCYLPLTMRFR